MCLNSSTCGTHEASRGQCGCGGKGGQPGGVHLRRAVSTDVRSLLALSGELAAYESVGHEFEATPELFATHFFGPDPRAYAILAHTGGNLAGFAVWYKTYSTFTGRPGAFVEELYVRPPFRKHGIGRALLAGAVHEAKTAGCARVEWRTLKWNDGAIKFYEGLGAKRQSEWTILRLEEPSLSAIPLPAGCK